MASSPAGSAPFGETIRYGGCDCCSGTPPCACCLDSIPDCVVTITDSPCADLIGTEAPIQIYDPHTGSYCWQTRVTDENEYFAQNYSNQFLQFVGVDVTASIGQATLDALVAPIYSSVAVPAGGVNKAFLRVAVECTDSGYLISFVLSLVNWSILRPHYILAAVVRDWTVDPTIEANCCPFALTFTDVGGKPASTAVGTGIVGTQFLPCLASPGLWSFALTGTRTGCTGEGGGD